MCKKIHRGGNAEQYHANKKYKEAVAVAVEACADDARAPDPDVHVPSVVGPKYPSRGVDVIYL